jgi:hypothetical protein
LCNIVFSRFYCDINEGDENLVKSRVLFFKGLILIAIVLMLISWNIPWWTCDITANKGILDNAVEIFPTGLV